MKYPWITQTLMVSPGSTNLVVPSNTHIEFGLKCIFHCIDELHYGRFGPILLKRSYYVNSMA